MFESGEVSFYWVRYSFVDEVLVFLCRDEYVGLLEIVNQQMCELFFVIFIFYVIEQVFNGIEFVYLAFVCDCLCCVLLVYDGYFIVIVYVFIVVDVLWFWRIGVQCEKFSYCK